MPHKILVVEDEPALRRMLKDDLELEGFEVAVAKDGEEGVQTALAGKPDLVLLDVMLPKLSGWEVCRQLKSKDKLLPVIMLTAKGQESDKVMGLGLGADDYVTKPFGMLELIARIKAVLRRAKPVDAAGPVRVQFGDVQVDFEKFEASKGGKALRFSAREFKILRVLLHNRGKVVTREQVLSEVWGYERMPESRTVDTHILALRRKLEGRGSRRGEFIQTVHGAGYKFVAGPPGS